MTRRVCLRPPRRLRRAALGLLLLAGAGCSSSYTGEWLFWRAQQANAPILKQPNQATPQQYARAIAAFEHVVRRVPGTVWAARAQMAIASLCAMQQQYKAARTAYELVLRNHGQEKELCLAALAAIAKTYEVENDWDGAVKAYRELSDLFPLSRMGMEAPLYVALVYERRQQPEEARQAYERAARVYSKLAVQAPSERLEIQLKGYLALSYQRLQKWAEAIRILEGLLDVPEGVNRPLVLLTLGTLYELKLSDRERAQTAYEQLLTEFPEHPFGKSAKLKLEHLGITMLPMGPSAPSAPSGAVTLPAATR